MSSKFEVKYRKAFTDDIPELIELRIKQLIDEGYSQIGDIRKELNAYFESSLDNGTLICWVGISKGNIVATAGLCFYQLPSSFSNPSGKIAYITNMYTCDDYRRDGIASFLIDKLLTEAKALNYSSVQLHASRHGRGVYEKAGFVNSDGYMGLKF